MLTEEQAKYTSSFFDQHVGLFSPITHSHNESWVACFIKDSICHKKKDLTGDEYYQDTENPFIRYSTHDKTRIELSPNDLTDAFARFTRQCIEINNALLNKINTATVPSTHEQEEYSKFQDDIINMYAVLAQNTEIRPFIFELEMKQDSKTQQYENHTVIKNDFLSSATPGEFN